MHNKPKISVLIPCHNIEEKPYFSLKSVLKNRYENMEILLLNDYSTDNTLKILENYAKEDKRIKVYDLKDYYEHVGLGFNSHFLAEKSTGDYFIFVDDDDKISSKMIEKFVENMDQDYDVLACGYKISMQVSKSRYCRTFTFPLFRRFNYNNPIEFCIFGDIYRWAKMIKRSYYFDLVEKYGLKFDGSIYEDVRYTWMILLSASKFKFLNKKLLTYQLRKNSINTSVKDIYKKIDTLFDSYDYAIDQIKRLNLLDSSEKFSLLKSTFLIWPLSFSYWSRFLQGISKKEYKQKVHERIQRFIDRNDIKLSNKYLKPLSKFFYKHALKIFNLKEKNN
ncbi:glycosyltransferase family 2 protein [Mycoplasma tauri]|uniref:glycosyltransferase family 2 protein n=1 Tax=Mycoplasma tauri TaxID=547987 RepID=UPI001967AF30|nr:glycosyltransferase family 2 protein [Mycoplasma tauri]QSB07697.1 glycosyltransferase family 2 protein [Mycoplasma tauri]